MNAKENEILGIEEISVILRRHMRKVVNVNKVSVQSSLKTYLELGKFRLSLFVVLSSFLGYLIGAKIFSYTECFWLSLGGLLITLASNAMNQIHEVELDAKMMRTQNRPLPLGKLSEDQAMHFALFAGTTGFLVLLYFLNLKTALLSLTSLMIYAYIYTPLKQQTSFAVFVGAFPGAFPPLIGYVAATNELNAAAWMIFAIQFLWQFPHFWAIAWVAFDDYKKAGFHLLPSKGGRDFHSASQIFIYTAILIPVSILPYTAGIAGIFYFIIALVTGTVFLFQSVDLMLKKSREAALKLMFGSFFYLPTVLLALYFDRV